MKKYMSAGLLLPFRNKKMAIYNNPARIILLLFLILIVFFLNAQEKPSFLAIRSGTSFPVGKYHSKNLDNGCFTMTGLTVSAEGAWFFKPGFGIGAATGINFHPVDVGMLGWEEIQDNPFLEDVYIRSEAYTMVTAMAGFYTQFPVIKKFSATGKILGGLLWGKTPYQLYKSQYYLTGLLYEEITSAQDLKFSWQAGIGFRYDISPCLGLVFDSEFMYDNLGFIFNTSSGPYTKKRTISFINTTLGIRFVL